VINESRSQEEQRMQDDLSRLIGLEGLVVTKLTEVCDQLDLEVELVARAGVCPHCACPTLEIKDRPVVAFRDLPLCGRRTRLLWKKRRYRCEGCARTHTESHPELPKRQRVTRRFRRRLFERVRSGCAHTEIAREERTTRYQVARAFGLGVLGQLDVVVDRPPSRRISLDEAAHRRGVQGLVTIVSDPDRRRVIDLVEGRDRRTIERYLRSLPAERKLAIEVVSIDPFEAYRKAIRCELPRARIVCDPFHLVRAANEALDTVRRGCQRGGPRHSWGTGKRTRLGGWRRDLFRSRRRLLKARQRLSARERRTLCELFAREPLVAEAWGLKEAFRLVYRATERREAELRLDRFLAAADRAAIASFESFAKGVRLWREELLAYFDEPLTNGYAEGVTNKVKVIKRRAYGLPSFEGFRARVLLACG
jgi:transposase